MCTLAVAVAIADACFAAAAAANTDDAAAAEELWWGLSELLSGKSLALDCAGRATVDALLDDKFAAQTPQNCWLKVTATSWLLALTAASATQVQPASWTSSTAGCGSH
jgi:hypothetical protein